MYHSITFGDRNTYDDWHLVPTSRPVINPPEPKTRIIDIPGANGVIDLSEALTGYPVYNNRVGSLEFLVLNGYKEWYNTYSDIMDYIHGKRMKAVLEDDPAYYYEGRFKVNSWKSEKDWSRIVIDYDLGPYKWLTKSSVDDWVWDTFNFKTDIIPTNIFKKMTVTVTGSKYIISGRLLGSAPVCPKIIFKSTGNSGGNIRFINRARSIDISSTLKEGINQIPDIIFTGEDIEITLFCNNGSGTATIEFNQGRL